MNFFQLLFVSVLEGQASLSLLLFLCSTLLLAVGVLMKARHSVRLTSLEYMPLRSIEYTHPHMPSAQSLLVIALCSATLLMAALQTVQGTYPFVDPFHGLNIASLFIIAASVAILAELQWKGAREFIGAALAGTAFAFLVMMIGLGAPAQSSAHNLMVLALLFPSLLLAGYVCARERRKAALLTGLLTFFAWILLFLIK